MRRLYLHIGAHKTGSTALQHNLLLNRNLLGDHGICHLASPTTGYLHTYLGTVSPYKLIPEGFTVLDREGLEDRLETVDRDVVVASSENLSFFFEKAPIAALEGLLRPYFDEITIVSYLRRQDRHAVSHHQEGAKPQRQAEGALWGHAPNALPDVSPDHDLYLDYDRRLGLWAEVFGADHLVLRVYDRALLKDGDIFADFMAVIGVDSAGLSTVGDRNVSLGASQTKAGHLMNAAGLRHREVEAVLQMVPAGGRLLPSRAQAAAFLERYRASNRRLNDKFKITALPDLFDDDMADLPDEPQNDWTEAGATAALRAILAKLTGTQQAGLQAVTADDYLAAALAMTPANPEAAYRMITAAAALRPHGPAIQRIKADLERRIGTA